MEIKPGVLKSFNVTTYKATVQVRGSLAVYLEDVPVARNIPSAEMVVERNCALLFFDEANPQDGVLIAVYT